jgi:hypothetical protein
VKKKKYRLISNGYGFKVQCWEPLFLGLFPAWRVVKVVDRDGDFCEMDSRSDRALAEEIMAELQHADEVDEAP